MAMKKVSVMVRKTWQEDPYEPFVLSLGMEEEMSTQLSEKNEKTQIKAIAEYLQGLMEEIYLERAKTKEEY